jgi:hypothetical protein
MSRRSLVPTGQFNCIAMGSGFWSVACVLYARPNAFGQRFPPGYEHFGRGTLVGVMHHYRQFAFIFACNHNRTPESDRPQYPSAGRVYLVNLASR